MCLFGALALLLASLASPSLGSVLVRAFTLSGPAPRLGSVPRLPRLPTLPTSPRSADALLPSPDEERGPRSPADLVVVVSIDGLRPDVVTPSMRALSRLSVQGAAPAFARTIHQSETLPSHASMVSGVEPSAHGLDFNAYKRERDNIRGPTMFSVARAAGIPSLMFVGKAKLRHLLGSPDDADFRLAGMQCRRLVSEAIPKLRSMKSGLIFMHFADPDAAGHRHGWMSDRYVEAAHDADACVERLMAVIQEGGHMARTLLLVTADHGGHGRSHGTRLEVDQRIPWYAWGGAARRGRVPREVHTTDTAATALAALGLKLPDTLQGKAVMEAIGAALGPVGMPIVGAPFEVSAN